MKSSRLSRSKATIKNNGLHRKHFFYLLTIAKHQVKDFVDQLQLDAIVNYIKLVHDSLHIITHSYELSNKYDQLHFHAIVRLSHRIIYKDNNSHKGFRLQWKPVYNWHGAHTYITKDATDKYKQEQILLENFYHHNYAFIN